MAKTHYFYLKGDGSVVHAPENAVKTLGEHDYFLKMGAEEYISTTDPSLENAKQKLEVKAEKSKSSETKTKKKKKKKDDSE